VLWSISPQLFAVGVSYSLAGTLLAVFLGRPLIRLNYDQLDREASFRARLVHVRENSESIALLRREGRLKARLIARLDALAENFQKIVAVNRNLGYFTTGYNYLIQIIPALIIAPAFIRGEVQFGVITQSAVAFGHLLGAFSLIVTQFQSISAYTAVVARLAALREAMAKPKPVDSPAVEVVEGVGSVAYERVTLLARDGGILVKDLTLSVPAGVRVLVRATSEAAEKALFRATADLWYRGEGRILHPGHDEIFFLPERPYLPPGTLREILLRTGEVEQVPSERILESLDALSLRTALDKAGGLDEEQSWAEILSLGEQQRLSFARVLLAEPRFVFMDHPSRGLSECPLGDLLQLLKQRGITYLTLGDTSDDTRYYDRILEIDDDGSWRVRPPRGREGCDTGGGEPPGGSEPGAPPPCPALKADR
jgi:putative ATP-binding cassette transporter